MQAKYNAENNATTNNDTEHNGKTTKRQVRYPSNVYRFVRNAFPGPFGQAVNVKIIEWQPSITGHKKVSLVQVRKPGNYKHKLDLADVGVTERCFIGGRMAKMKQTEDAHEYSTVPQSILIGCGIWRETVRMSFTI